MKGPNTTSPNQLCKNHGETQSQLYEAQLRVTEIEETVSDIQGVNVVINETIKVQEQIIQNLQEDLGIQEDTKVVEIALEHNTENTCNKCDYIASKNIYMKSHMLKHNTGQKCNKCQKTFNSIKVLEDHIKTSHITKLLACTECDAKFMVEHALLQHTKAVHKNSTKNKCGNCRESFNNIKDLEEHIQKSHTTKLLACNKCNAKFMVENALSQHMLSVHKKSTTNKCEKCRESFDNRLRRTQAEVPCSKSI